MHTAATRAQPDAAATFAVGQLVRIAKPTSGLVGMTGTVTLVRDGKVSVRLTAWGRVAWYLAADLVAVERGGR